VKADIHPEYFPVVYVDVSTGDEVITRSTLKSEKSRDIDGVSHFVINCDITSFSHPVFTGDDGGRNLDTAGRIERFRRKYGDKTTTGN